MRIALKASFALVAAAALLVSPTLAADSAAGRVTARQCQACHGMDGLSKLPEAPNLRGQVEDYLAKSLHDYKSGARRNDMMTVMASELSEDEIANLAAYYSSLQ
jgi:cytochrome c553